VDSKFVCFEVDMLSMSLTGVFVVQNQQRSAALSYSTVAGTTPVLPVEQCAVVQHCQCTRYTLPQHSSRKDHLHCPLWCQLCEYWYSKGHY